MSRYNSLHSKNTFLASIITADKAALAIDGGLIYLRYTKCILGSQWGIVCSLKTDIPFLMENVTA